MDLERESPLAFYAFDLLHFDGADWRDASCLERRRALAEIHRALTPEVAKVIRFSEHVQGKGSDFWHQACALGVEGIVSKRAGSPYRPGRGRDWLKVKCTQGQEFVI